MHQILTCFPFSKAVQEVINWIAQQQKPDWIAFDFMILDIYASFHTWFLSHFRSNWKRHWSWIGTTRQHWNIARQLIATVSDKKYFDCWTTKQIVWILRYLSFHIKIPLFDFSWEIAEDDSKTDLHVVSSNYIFKGIFCLHKAVLGPPIVHLGDLQKYVFFLLENYYFRWACLREIRDVQGKSR